MSRTATLKRSAITAVAALALGAGAASPALADGLPITANPNPSVAPCWSTGLSSFSCKIGDKLIACHKGSTGDWYCASAQIPR